MADFDDDDLDDVWEEADPDAELTGKEPKFVKIPEMHDDKGEPLEFKALQAMAVDKLVPIYIAVRNQLATDNKGHKDRKAKLKEFQSLISMALREKADIVGTDQFKGAYGTAYRHTKEKFTINDWDSFVEYLKSTHNFQILQKRVSPNAVKEIRDADGAIPPGVGTFTEIEFAVRAPSKRSK